LTGGAEDEAIRRAAGSQTALPELESRLLPYTGEVARGNLLRQRIKRLNRRLAPLNMRIREQRSAGYYVCWDD